MKIVKVVDKTKTKTAKSGKTYHPSYYLLKCEKFDDGINASFLINLVNYEDRKLLESIAEIKVKEVTKA